MVAYGRIRAQNWRIRLSPFFIKLMQRSRSWCFTINNWTEDDVRLVKTTGATYIVFGFEKGETEGTQHLQGYIEFADAKTLNKMKKLLPRAHLEIKRGTADQAAEYCKKDGHYVEFGEISHQGLAQGIVDATTKILAHESLSEIATSDPVTFVRYHKGLERLHYINETDRETKPTVVWLWGLAGTGKTREACNCDSFYIKDGTQWWDGYDFQQRIVIDDFDGHWPFRDFLRLLDRYPYQGQFKGGYLKINSPEIYITCEHSPEHWWCHNELAQVTRRIDKVINLL